MHLERNKIKILILVYICLIPILVVFYSNNYHPNNDEAYQLQASIRLAEGKGVTSTFDATPTNKNMDSYKYLYWWPPGYSIFIAGFLKMGLNVDTAGKVIKTIVAILMLFFWAALYNKIISTKKNIYFTFYLCLISILISINFYLSTDLIYWTVFPLILLLLINYTETNKKHNIFSRKYILLLGLSLTVTFLIFIKLHAVFIIILIALWLFFENYDKLKRVYIEIPFVSILPTLAFIFIRYLNNSLANATSNNADVSQFTLKFLLNPEWYGNVILKYSEALFMKPILVDKAIDHLITILNIESSSFIVNSIITLFILTTVLLAFRYNLKFFKNKLPLKFYIISLVSLSLFYIILSGFGENYLRYWPWIRARYHFMIFPLLLIVIIQVASKFDLKYSKLFVFGKYLSLIITFIIIFIISYYHYKPKFEGFTINKNIIENNIQSITEDYDGHSFAIASKPYFQTILYDNFIPTYREHTSSVIFNDSTFFERKTTVFVILNDTVDLNYYVSDKKRIEFDDFIDSFNLRKLKGHDNQKILLYWKVFPKGFLFKNHYSAISRNFNSVNK